jgi:hypothetical protein
MTSFQIALSPNRRAAARFIGQVRRSLQKAYVEEQKKNGLSQSEIARMIKVHRSVINRELKGLKDMTIGRVGELSWAMGRRPLFTAEELNKNPSANFQSAPSPQAVPVPLPTPPAATSVPQPPTGFFQMPPLITAAA